MLKSLLRWLCKLVFRVEVRGQPLSGKPGKMLIIANHESYLDGFLLGLFLPFDATFVVHTTVLKNPLFRAILSLTNYLAVDPTSPMAMKKVIRLLEAGEPVVIFPEGRITLTGSMMKVYDGPAFVAAKSGAPILPARLDGTGRSYFSRLEGHHPRQFFPKISLSLLPLTALPMPEAPKARDRRRLAGEKMRRLMQEMVFASQPTDTLFTALLDSIELHGRKSLVLEDVNQVEENYQVILKKTLALGRLTAKITSPGETIGVLMPNVSNTVGLIFGMSAFGRVPAMLNYTAGTAGMQAACVAARIRLILTSRQFLEKAKLEPAVNALENVKIVCLEDLRPQFSLWDKLWLMGYALWLPRCATATHRPKDPNAHAVVLFTSGSEGKPKGVVHSHRGILANIAQIRAIIDFSPADKFMMALPLFHAFGFTCGAIMPLVTASKMFLYPSPLHYRIIPVLIPKLLELFRRVAGGVNFSKNISPIDLHLARA